MLKYHEVLLDEARLNIILYNLVSNSVRHTSGGKIHLNANLLDREEFEVIHKEYKDKQQHVKPNTHVENEQDDEMRSSVTS